MRPLLSGAVRLDPATLSPDGWWRGSFAPPPPWLPRAPAAGNLVLKGASPTAGPNVNGVAPARFNGTTQSLQSSAPISDYVSVNPGFTLLAFFRPLTLALHQANFWDDDALFSELIGDLALTVTDLGVRSSIFVGSSNSTVPIPLAANTWGMAAMRWKYLSGAAAGELHCRVSQASGTVDAAAVPFSWTSSIGTRLYVGQNYNDLKFFNFDSPEILLWKRPLTNGELDYMRRYFNQRYNQGLT